MSDNVIELPVVTKLDIPVERVLRKAAEVGLAHVVVVGVTADGDEYFASSVADGGDILWMFERAKLQLLQIGHKG